MAGLRERKKARTREEIVEAALTLFEKRGFDGTTIDDVAVAAEVSPRTVFRYFTSKEDLVFMGQDEENQRVAELVKRTQRTSDPITTLLQGTREILLGGATPSAQLVRSRELVARTPSLRSHQARVRQSLEQMVVSALTPSHASKHEVLRSRLIAAVYLSALDVLMDAWIEAGARGQPTEELDQAETIVRRAFKEPARDRGRRR